MKALKLWRVELRDRGVHRILSARANGAANGGPGRCDDSGAERRMAGGLGAKKVDTTWATEESGLILAVSIKTINFRDGTTKNYQKNLVNRRGDMLMEAVTLHRRFPYAVLGALFFLDKGASQDATPKRKSTLENAHPRLRLFTGRDDPAGRDEQFERFYLLIVDASPNAVELKAYEVGKPEVVIPMEQVIDSLLAIVAERNPDFYEFDAGNIIKVPGA